MWIGLLYTPNQIKLTSGLTSTLLLLAFTGNAMALGSKGRVEPLFSRYAQTYKAPTLDFKVETFNDKPMEEMNNFNGQTITLDFTYPLNDISQIELLLPVYTNGKGNLDDDLDPGETFPGGAVRGDKVKVKGYGGVRDFVSLIYERQIPSLEKKLDVNIAWLFGAGMRMDTIDAKFEGTLVDKYNHQGYNLQAGLKVDTDVKDKEITLLGDFRYIQYLLTDDINFERPGKSGSDVNFGVFEFNSAIMFNNTFDIIPVLEALFVQDTRGYTSFSLSPEIIYGVSDGIDIKLGVPFKLTKQGQNYAGVLEGTYRF